MNRAQKRQSKVTKPTLVSTKKVAKKSNNNKKATKKITKITTKRSFTTAAAAAAPPTPAPGATPAEGEANYADEWTPHELKKYNDDAELNEQDAHKRFVHILNTSMSYDLKGNPVDPDADQVLDTILRASTANLEEAGITDWHRIHTAEQTAAAVKTYNTYLHSKGKVSSHDEAQIALKASLEADKQRLDWHALPDYPLSPKLSTCITGIPAIPNGRDVLDNLLINTISMASQRYKADKQFIWSSIYNTAVFRLQVLRKFPNDDHMVTRIIGAGQIEELIEQQEEEMTLFQTLYDKPEPNIDPEVLRGAAPAFGSTNPLCETKIFPLPAEVAQEVAGGKVTINPYHPTKPLSRKFVQHLGFGDLITPEEHAKYDELTALSQEEQAMAVERLPFVMAMVEDDLTDSFITRKHPQGLPDEFFEFFKTSPYVYPELDTKFVEQWKEAHEIHTRKL